MVTSMTNAARQEGCAAGWKAGLRPSWRHPVSLLSMWEPREASSGGRGGGWPAEVTDPEMEAFTLRASRAPGKVTMTLPGTAAMWLAAGHACSEGEPGSRT